MMIQVSASQIELYEKCPRAWGFKYLTKIPDPEQPWRKKGTRIHSVAEGYLVTGNIPTWESFQAEDPEGRDPSAREDYELGERLVATAIKNGHLPEGGRSNLLVEHKITHPVADGIELVGYIDLVHDEDDENRVNIEDHKTTSSFDYCKTPEELRENLQLACYATYIHQHAPERHIRLGHVYYLTRNKIKTMTHKVTVDVSPEDFQKVWDNRVVPASQEIFFHRKNATDPMELQPKGTLNGHCQAFRGCHHRERCGINQESTGGTGSPLFQIGGSMGNALLDRLKAKNAPETPAVSPTPAPAPTPTPAAQDDSKALLAKLAASGKGQPALAGEVAQAVVEDLPAGAGLAGSGELAKTVVRTTAELAQVATATLAGVVPPDAAPRTDDDPTPAPVKTEPAPTEEIIKRRPGRPPAQRVTCPACRAQTSLDKDGCIRDHAGVDAHGRPDKMAPCVVSGDTMGEATAWVNKPLPAIPRGADEEETSEPPPAERCAPSPLLEDQPSSKETTRATPAGGGSVVTKKPERKSFTIFLDTFPQRGFNVDPCSNFETWIQPIMEKAAQAAGVLDYRLIDYKAAGVLAVAIREHVKEHGLPEMMVVNSKTGPWNVAREVLIPNATHLITPAIG